jgi:hypothetical protein
MRDENNNKKEEITIDYENIDVEDIMGQIKKKIASQPKGSEPEEPFQPGYPVAQASSPPQPGPSGKKAKMKNIVLKIIKPISPVIKFLVLPVHQELKDTIQNLHATNQRIDSLERRIDGNFSKVHQELQAIMLRLEELNRVREYTQLLHNLSHNVVVELTKLKIEQENLKLKTRIMEKDFEFLGRREKTLESKVFG